MILIFALREQVLKRILRLSYSKINFTNIAVNKAEEVLIALRRVIRATDIHSRYLAKTIGLTAPQILLLQTIEANQDAKISEMAEQMSVSQSTATNILARLESRGLVCRQRSTDDKRKVHVSLTEEGQRILANAPIPLQDRFTVQFEQLEEWEQSMIISAFQRVASMMNATDIDASPLLHLGSIEEAADKDHTKNQSKTGS